MTALSVYGMSGASTTLPTASLLVSVTGGVGANQSTKLGSALNFGEIPGQGTTNAWAASGSIGSPTGLGFLYDTTALEGQTIAAGNWNGSIRVSVSTGSMTVTMYMRAFKRSSGGIYTPIVTLSLASQTVTTTLTNFSMNSGSGVSMAFATGDKLYTDIWFDVLTNSTSSTSSINNTVASGSTSGLAGRSEWDSPGFSPTPPSTGRLIYYMHRRVGYV